MLNFTSKCITLHRTISMIITSPLNPEVQRLPYNPEFSPLTKQSEDIGFTTHT